MTLEEMLKMLEEGITKVDHPHPVTITAAKYFMAEYDRELLPDWVEALANANPDNWAAAVDEVYRMICIESGAKS